MEVMTGRKVFVCSDEVGKRNVFALTDKTWLTVGRERSGRAKREERGGEDRTPVEGGVRVVNIFDGFVVCGGFELGASAALCLEEDVGTVVDPYVIEVEFSEAATVIDVVVKELHLEGA